MWRRTGLLGILFVLVTMFCSHEVLAQDITNPMRWALISPSGELIMVKGIITGPCGVVANCGWSAAIPICSVPEVDIYVASDYLGLEFYSPEYIRGYLENGKFEARLYFVPKKKSSLDLPSGTFIATAVTAIDAKNMTTRCSSESYLDVHGNYLGGKNVDSKPNQWQSKAKCDLIGKIDSILREVATSSRMEMLLEEREAQMERFREAEKEKTDPTRALEAANWLYNRGLLYEKAGYHYGAVRDF